MTDKLTLALVSAFPPGQKSLNEYGYHLVREFLARDDVAKVIVLADKIEAPLPELDLGPKLEVRRVWTFNSLESGVRILRELRRCKPNGVIFNVQTASFGDREVPAALGLMVPMLARWIGAPSGVIAHNIITGIDLENTILKGQRLRQAIVKAGGNIVSRAMCAASYVTVTLRGYEQHLKGRYPKTDLTHVPHGTFDTGESEIKPMSKRPKRIVTMGKFGTYKRLETMLEAFRILREDMRFSDYELVIGGTDHPNAKGYVEELAREWKSDAQVNFYGYVAEDDVPAFFSEARISVFDYSATTGSSGVLHQTASNGTVPVFPNIGDFVEVSEGEGLQGFHFEPDSVDSMVDAMERALVDPDHADAIAHSNQQASMDVPLAQIAAFHVDKIKTLRPETSPEVSRGVAPQSN